MFNEEPLHCFLISIGGDFEVLRGPNEICAPIGAKVFHWPSDRLEPSKGIDEARSVHGIDHFNVNS